MECIRIFSSNEDILKVVIEPWGNEYDVPKGCYLSVVSDTQPSRTHIEQQGPNVINLYIDGADLDIDNTNIVERKIML